MFNFFKPKPILSEEDIGFQIATFRWLLTHFGGKYFYDNTALILPTEEYFPATVKNSTDIAEKTFETVKSYAGLQDWPCKLEAQSEDINQIVAPTIAIQNVPSTPLGTFKYEPDKDIIISYNPKLVNSPSQLVATYAHELAHYLTSTCSEEPPGGWENWEFATDITATFLGFGIFMANNAFKFQQFQSFDHQGWEVEHAGYLSEEEHIFALAIFLKLKQYDIEQALPYLKPSLKPLLKKALRALAKTNIIEELLSVEYVPFTT